MCALCGGFFLLFYVCAGARVDPNPKRVPLVPFLCGASLSSCLAAGRRSGQRSWKGGGRTSFATAPASSSGTSRATAKRKLPTRWAWPSRRCEERVGQSRSRGVPLCRATQTPTPRRHRTGQRRGPRVAPGRHPPPPTRGRGAMSPPRGPLRLVCLELSPDALAAVVEL